MSNCEVTELPLLEVEQFRVREVLRCILHTIIFNRALGPVKPREVDSDLFDITYVQCGDPSVEARVEEKINHFYNWVERHPRKRGQVSLAFYEKRKKQSGWSIIGGKQEERLYWEQWLISLSIVASSVSQEEQSSFASASGRTKRAERLQAGVEGVLAAVLRAVNDKKDHIPPVVSPATLTFPFDITIVGESGLNFGLDTVKRLLMQATPPPVLN